MAMSDKAREVKNAKARAYYAAHKEQQKAANERYFEKLAAKVSPVYEWVKRHEQPPKSVGRFYSYEIICDETGLDTKGVIEELHRIRKILLKEEIAIQIGVKSNGSRGIRVINLK